MKALAKKVVSAFASFVHWWVGELSSSAQAALSGIHPLWTKPQRLFAHGNEIVWLRTDADSQVLARRDSPTGRFSLETAAENPAGPILATRLVLTSDCAFVRQLIFPLAALPHLESALELQLPQLLPLSPSLLAVDYAITQVEPGQDQFSVDIAAIRRADVDMLVRDVEQWGFRVVSVHIADDANSAERFNFSGLITRRLSIGSLSRLETGLFASAVALGIACAGTAFAQGMRADHALNKALDDIWPKAHLALRRRLDLQAHIQPLKALADEERGPEAAHILQGLTEVIPHDSWLTSFELKGHSLQLEGFTPDSGRLTRVLAGSPQLNDVTLHSSISNSGGIGRDRFQITATVKGGTQ